MVVVVEEGAGGAKASLLHEPRPSHFYGNAAIHIPFLIFARSKSIKANVLMALALAAEKGWGCERKAPQLYFALVKWLLVNTER